MITDVIFRFKRSLFPFPAFLTGFYISSTPDLFHFSTKSVAPLDTAQKHKHLVQ